jgi:class 3 adenylate cyclase/tetratricopeptide (TPR) repeat protein
MANSGQQRPAERRVVSALFCDIAGSTSLAEAMDPEDWADIVNATVAEMTTCVERYGGTVAQFAGDSILAVFGAPVAHEDDPYRAIRAGLDIIEGLGTSGASAVPFEVRAGVHTGVVIIGDLTAGDVNVYAPLGDTANVAARMQTLADPGTLLVSADTYRLVSDDVTADDLGPIDVKGKAEPINVFRIRDARPVSMRRRGVPGFESPMVGRSAELGRLREAVEAGAAGSGRVTAIVGDAGVGKSRLLAELHESVAVMPKANWVLARCAAYDQHRPYHLAASLVLALASVTESDDPDVVVKAVSGLVDAALGADSPSLHHLLQLLGIEAGHPDDNPAVLHDYYNSALTGLITGVSAESAPLVVVCEDVHWADASSVDLLAGMLGHLRQTPTVLIIVSRPDRGSHGWNLVAGADRELGEAFAELRLEPLDDGDSRALVANLLEIESLPDELRDLVLSRAEGNPFFIEEVVRMLVDRGLVRRHEDKWVADSGISTLDVPDTLHGLLTSRIDTLPAEARYVARVAAVIGRRFETRLLSLVLRSDDVGEQPTVPPELNVLEAEGLIKLVAARPELAFSFRHALTHDVTYESILKKERRRLHTAVGDAVAKLYPDRAEEYAPILARHFEEAGDRDKTLHHLLVAGHAAANRHAMPESHDFYGRALALLDVDPDASARLKIETALSAAEAGMRFVPGGTTVAALEAIRGDAETFGDPDLVAKVYALILRVRTIMEENYADPAFREVMDRAYAIAPQVSEPDLRAFLMGMMGQVLRSADEYEAAVDLTGGSVDPLEAAGRVGEAGLNAAMAADVEATRGRFAEAERWIERGSALADASGNPNVIADVALIKGRIAAARGELETALVHSRRGMETAEGVGNIECTLVGNFLVADQHLRRGDAAAAIPHLERTFELGAFCNAEAMVALGHAWLATAKARLGEFDPEGFSEPLRKAQAFGSRSGEAAVRLQRAVAVSGGTDPDLAQAITDFERSIALFESIGARPDQARATHAYANALEAAGQAEEGQAQLAAAAAMFDAMGIRPDA